MTTPPPMPRSPEAAPPRAPIQRPCQRLRPGPPVAGSSPALPGAPGGHRQEGHEDEPHGPLRQGVGEEGAAADPDDEAGHQERHQPEVDGRAAVVGEHRREPDREEEHRQGDPLGLVLVEPEEEAEERHQHHAAAHAEQARGEAADQADERAEEEQSTGAQPSPDRPAWRLDRPRRPWCRLRRPARRAPEVTP